MVISLCSCISVFGLEENGFNRNICSLEIVLPISSFCCGVLSNGDMAIPCGMQGDFLVHFMDTARDELAKRPSAMSMEKLQVRTLYPLVSCLC
jgi:hypothetical protein